MKTIVLFFSLLLNMHAFASHAAFSTLEGQEISSKELQGRWLVLQYWAEWCDICMGEMPELQDLYNHINKSKARMYLVNFDGLSQRQLQKFFNQHHISIPSLKGDPAGAYGIHGITALPVMIVVNPQGKVHKVLYGPQSSRKILRMLK